MMGSTVITGMHILVFRRVVSLAHFCIFCIHICVSALKTSWLPMRMMLLYLHQSHLWVGPDIAEFLNRDLARISAWCKSWEMKLNASKTQSMVLAGREHWIILNLIFSLTTFL